MEKLLNEKYFVLTFVVLFLFKVPTAFADSSSTVSREGIIELTLAQLDQKDRERLTSRIAKEEKELKETPTVKFTGYYKNLTAVSKTISTKEDFFANTQRLRLESNAKLSDNFSVLLIYDNDVIINDFSRTSDFELIRQKNQKELNYLDIDKTLSDRRHFYWKHSLYRAYLKYVSNSLHFIVGKQAIDWSRMRLYHSFDLFNPISPLDLEKDEKVGVDALNIEIYPAELTSVNFIYLPYKSREKSGLGIRTSKKINDYDISLIAAEYKKDSTLGFSFDGYIKEAGFRGELTATKKDNQKEFIRTSIGFDHNFSPQFYTVAEYFYNGGAEKDISGFLNSYEFSRQAMSIRKHILGTGAEYEISGITKFATYTFYDFEGEGIFLNPELRQNVFTNMDINLGSQVFWGNEQSEFGYENTYYCQLKYFF